MVERWREVEGFPSYSISDHGRLISRRGSCPKFLAGTKHLKGYTVYMLRDVSGKPRITLAHRLVGLHFLPKPSAEQTDVCHNDGDPSNSHYSNLRWDTHQANQMDMRKHGTMQDGEKCVTHKLTEDEVRSIRHRVANGPRGMARWLAQEHNISISQMSRIVNGRRWKSTLENSHAN